MTIMLKKHLYKFSVEKLVKSLAKTIVSAGIMVIVLLLTDSLDMYMPAKISHLLRILIGASTFFTIAILLKSTEVDSVKYILDRVFKKKTYENN